MPTLRDFIVIALKEAGVIGVGQTPLAEDITNGYITLNQMFSLWAQQRYIVPMLHEVIMPGNNLKSNKIGPGQYYNAPRPTRIDAAYIVQVNPPNSPQNLVSIPLSPIMSYEEYSRLSIKGLNSLPNFYFYDNAFPNGNVFVWPIPSESYNVHLIIKGNIGFNTQISNGYIVIGGTGYTNGFFQSIPFVGGTGSGASADVTINSGAITDVVIANPGNGYNINDVLAIDNSLIGGVGTGFLYKITNTEVSYDSVFNMPPEYEEPVKYNLALRLCSLYQTDPNRVTMTLAKKGLHILRANNAQIPELQMPAILVGRNKAFNIYNADGY